MVKVNIDQMSSWTMNTRSATLGKMIVGSVLIKSEVLLRRGSKLANGFKSSSQTLVY